MLTAVTTILGLIPMITDVSFDFHHLTISWVSESSQWWRSVAVVVIFGLMISTFLTLIVVPTLYYMQKCSVELFHQAWRIVNNRYWALFDRFFP